MDNATIFLWVVLIIFNVATAKILSFTLGKIDFVSALSEKNESSGATAPAVPPLPMLSAPGNAPSGLPQSTPADTSYSRVSGMVGSVILATFFWACANIILFKSLTDVSGVTIFVTSVQSFFLVGATLFAPYAVNQFRSAFSNN